MVVAIARATEMGATGAADSTERDKVSMTQRTYFLTTDMDS